MKWTHTFSFQGGLKKETHDSASVKCWPTYVRDLPTGKEQGKFLALDLGGTNFRVLALELTEDKEFLMDSKIYAIPQEIMTGKNIKTVRDGVYWAGSLNMH